MAMTNGQVQASSGAQVSGTFPPQGVVSAVNPLKNTSISQAVAAQMNLVFGTGSGKVNLIVCSDHNLTAAGGLTPSAVYDLYTGTDLKDLDGGAAPFRVVRYVAVSILTGGDTAGLRVGGNSGSGDVWPGFFADASDKVLTFPAGVPFQAGSPAGVAVGTTTKNLFVENLSALALTFRIVVAGSATT